jgi:hypothetical protein
MDDFLVNEPLNGALNEIYDSSIYQQNTNNNLIINSENIEIIVKALPFTFYEEPTPKLEYHNNGNKIICPKYILYELSKYENIAYPITFKYKDYYLGVLEFKEFIDEMYIPNHIFYQLGIEENESINLEILSKSLEKACFLKIKPQSDDFYKITDQKKYLETHFRNLFTVLKEKDTINLIYQNTKMPISIIECKPTNLVLMDEIEELVIDIEPLYEKKDAKDSKGVIFSMNTSLNKKDENKKDENKKNNTTELEPVFVPFSGKGHKLGN